MRVFRLTSPPFHLFLLLLLHREEDGVVRRGAANARGQAEATGRQQCVLVFPRLTEADCELTVSACCQQRLCWMSLVVARHSVSAETFSRLCTDCRLCRRAVGRKTAAQKTDSVGTDCFCQIRPLTNSSYRRPVRAVTRTAHGRCRRGCSDTRVFSLDYWRGSRSRHRQLVKQQQHQRWRQQNGRCRRQRSAGSAREGAGGESAQSRAAGTNRRARPGDALPRPNAHTTGSRGSLPSSPHSIRWSAGLLACNGARSASAQVAAADRSVSSARWWRRCCCRRGRQCRRWRCDDGGRAAQLVELFVIQQRFEFWHAAAREAAANAMIATGARKHCCVACLFAIRSFNWCSLVLVRVRCTCCLLVRAREDDLCG